MKFFNDDKLVKENGKPVNFNFAGYVCHVFNKDTGINLESKLFQVKVSSFFIDSFF